MGLIGRLCQSGQHCSFDNPMNASGKGSVGERMGTVHAIAYRRGDRFPRF